MDMTTQAPSADLAGIRAHLAFLTRRWRELDEPAWIELRALGEGVSPQSARFRAADLDAAADWAAAMNRLRDRNLYVVANPIRDTRGRDATDADVIASFLHWADADAAGAVASLNAWAGPKWRFAVVTGRTPHTRVHVYWELNEPARDLAAWRQTQQNIAAQFGSDRSVINPSRIMRLGGTITWPAENKRARGYVQEAATFRAWPERELQDGPTFARLFAGTRPEQQVEPKSEGFAFDTAEQGAPLDREAARAAALSGEEWHTHVVKLTASYVAKGLSDEEIHAITDRLTLPGYTVEQTRREVQTAIDGARRKGWAPPAADYADPAEIDAASFDAPPSERPSLEWFDDIEPALTDSYVVKELLTQGGLSVLYGQSNTGKTFFALDLAFRIATSTAWRGRRVNGGGVLYLAAEGGRGAANRIAALKIETGVCEVPLALKRAGLDLLRSTADLRTVVALASAVAARAPLRLIVVDTLSRVMAGGDENAPQDMTALIRNIDAIRAATGAHVMLVHHSGKDEARGARGHSSLRAAVDTEIEVVNDDGFRAAFVRKQRDYQGGECFAFDLKAVELGQDQDGDPVVSCVLECADDAAFLAARKATRGLGGNQKIIADTFDQMLSEGLGKPNPGGVGMPEPGRFWAVDMGELRRIARGKMSGADTKRGFNAALAVLTGERGLMGAGETLVWRVDRPCKHSQ